MSGLPEGPRGAEMSRGQGWDPNVSASANTEMVSLDSASWRRARPSLFPGSWDRGSTGTVGSEAVIRKLIRSANASEDPPFPAMAGLQMENREPWGRGVQGAEPRQGECSLKVWGHLVYRKVSHDHTRLQKGLSLHMCVCPEGHLLASQQFPRHSRCCWDTGILGWGADSTPHKVRQPCTSQLLPLSCLWIAKWIHSRIKHPRGARVREAGKHFPQGEQEEFAKVAGVPPTWTGIQPCQHQRLVFI